MDSNLIIFDVYGQIIKTYRNNIILKGKGLLFELLDSVPKEENKEIFIDENPSIFISILDYYRTTILERPLNVSEKVWLKRLDYWGLNEIYEVTNKKYSELDYFLYFTQPFITNVDKLTQKYECDGKSMNFSEYKKKHLFNIYIFGSKLRIII